MKLEKCYGDVEDNEGNWEWCDVVKWTPELQKLTDRDEVSKTKVKFAYSITEAYDSSNRFECECGYDEILEGAVFCSSCGQRLNW